MVGDGEYKVGSLPKKAFPVQVVRLERHTKFVGM